MQTQHLKLAECNKRPWIMMCSKPCRYLFTDLICYFSPDLLIAAFSVHSVFVIVVVLWQFVRTNYGWSSREYTGLFRCVLLIYWFLSCLFAVRCVQTCPREHEGMFVKDRWRRVAVSMCWKWVDLIYTGVFAQQRREGGRRLIYWLPVCFLFHSLSVFSHMLVPFCLYCSLSHLSHSLPETVFASKPTLNPLSLSASHCVALPGCSQYLHFLLFCLFLSHKHSIPADSPFSLPAYYRSISPFSRCGFQKSSQGRWHK